MACCSAWALASGVAWSASPTRTSVGMVSAAAAAREVGGGDGLGGAGIALRRRRQQQLAERLGDMRRRLRRDPAGEDGVGDARHALARGPAAARSCHRLAGGMARAVSIRTSERTRCGACAATDCAIRPPIDRPTTSARVDAERVQHRQRIGAELGDAVGARGDLGAAMAAHVGAEDAEAGGQRRDDGVPDLQTGAERMQQQQGGRVRRPVLADQDLQVVQLHLLEPGHVRVSSLVAGCGQERRRAQPGDRQPHGQARRTAAAR